MSESGDSSVAQDTLRVVDSGRETLGSMLRTAQKHLQKVFIVFVIGMIGTIYAMRLYIWPLLQQNTRSRMSSALAGQVKFIATTPFDVILMQVKIGLIVGAIVSVPLLLYLGRDAIKEREWYPAGKISVWKAGVVAALAILLFFGGMVYGYYVFFPFLFKFLASNAVQAGIRPTYSIVKWTGFIMVFLLSFGLAAELPLAMSGLSYTGIVSYKFFRSTWRHAIVLIFVFGAFFSPPDVFTQLMWAVPLLGLYAVSLGLAKLFDRAGAGRRGGSEPAELTADDLDDLDVQGVAAAPRSVFTGLTEDEALEHAQRAMAEDDPDKAQEILDRFDRAQEVEEADLGSPEGLDVDELDLAGVQAVPAETFAAMTEDEALEHAQHAMAEDDPDRAQAILDRYDEAHPATADATGGSSDGAPAGGATDGATDDAESSGGVFSRTSAGMLSAFTDDETTEEDIGGWYYDLAFIASSLRSRIFRVVALFIVVMASIFLALYSGGLGVIREDFFARIPESVRPDSLGLVALHPVEALVFEVKIAALIGAVVSFPLLLYYAWPALEERGFAAGKRSVVKTWGVAIVVGLVVGSILGYAVIAPGIISYLVYDVIQANMVVSYRLSNFFWLVFLSTVGIGLLADIPVLMMLLHRGKLVTYRSMRRRWREVTIGILVVSALVTPGTVLSMLLIAFPTAVFYLIGLGILWVLTLGGRRGGPKPDAEVASAQQSD